VIVGIDEAGIGCMAGPAFVAAVGIRGEVMFPHSVRDSKDCGNVLQVRDIVMEMADWHTVRRISVAEINELGIWPAWDRAVTEILGSLRGDKSVTSVTVDGCRVVPAHGWATYRVGADRDVPVVSAASIMAKGSQLLFSDKMHYLCPQYGFNEHHGYVTKQHKEALDRWGACPFHRTSYKPVQKRLEEEHGHQGSAAHGGFGGGALRRYTHRSRHLGGQPGR